MTTCDILTEMYVVTLLHTTAQVQEFMVLRSISSALWAICISPCILKVLMLVPPEFSLARLES